jgi:hypothetical protein
VKQNEKPSSRCDRVRVVDESDLRIVLVRKQNVLEVLFVKEISLSTGRANIAEMGPFLHLQGMILHHPCVLVPQSPAKQLYGVLVLLRQGGISAIQGRNELLEDAVVMLLIKILVSL